jgi:hypothetical protein
MSRAFVKETAESAPPPERMVDEGPNLVTREGLAQIEAHLARIEAGMKSETNVLLRETINSGGAKATPELMPSPPRDSDLRRARHAETSEKGRQLCPALL